MGEPPELIVVLFCEGVRATGMAFLVVEGISCRGILKCPCNVEDIDDDVYS